MSNVRKTVLITGASQGIGYELSRLFARDGYTLVLVARHTEKLQDAAQQLEKEFHVPVCTIVKDLAQPNSAKEIYKELQQAQIKVNVLVNNAGFGLHGAFSENSLEEYLKMIQVNLTAIVQLTHIFLGDMLKENNGKILQIGSIAAFKPGPFGAVYYAAKSFLLSFSEALNGELKKTGVSVSILCPGPVKTAFQERARMKITPVIKANFLDASTVARIGYQGLMRKQMIIIPGIKNRMMALLFRYLPRDWSLQLVLKVQNRFR